MAPDEYSTGGGGRLKLKGSKVSDGRVEKKKKKKGVKKEKEKSEAETEAGAEKEVEKVQSRSQSREPGEGGDDGREQREGSAAKTEAERKYEEVRRKRVCFFYFSFADKREG
jgi:protein FAM32A